MFGKVKHVSVGLALPAVGACASTTSNQNFDPDVNFASYQTIALLDEPLIFFSDTELNPEVVRVVSESIENELVAKGFTQAASPETADFTVGFAVGATRYIETRLLPSTYHSALGTPWSVGYYEFEEREIEVREGSLAIHIFDVDGKKAVFSTTGTKRLGKKDTPEGIAEISPAVKALLAEFPPS